MASSTSPSTPGSVAGSVSRWRRVCPRATRTGPWARWVWLTRPAWTGRPRSAAPSTSSRSSRSRSVSPAPEAVSSGAGAFRPLPIHRKAGPGEHVKTSAVLLLALLLLGGSATAGHLKELRVCGDPDNLPFSNEKQEGFENRIAEVIAKDLGATLSYYWWPHQRGLVRNTLTANKCDVLIGIPKGYDPVMWTKPYYRSTHVMVYPTGKGWHIRSLDDPVLKQLRIGVHRGAPP